MQTEGRTAFASFFDVGGFILVDEHERLLGSRFLESPLPNAAVISAEAGQTVGAYTLDIPLGAGGMGTVWRARRSDGRFEGDVAVKLLNLATRASAGEERFKRAAWCELS